MNLQVMRKMTNTVTVYANNAGNIRGIRRKQAIRCSNCRYWFHYNCTDTDLAGRSEEEMGTTNSLANTAKYIKITYIAIGFENIIA